MPIFRVKSVKIYTSQKNLHWRRRPRRRQLSGMCGIHSHWSGNNFAPNLYNLVFQHCRLRVDELIDKSKTTSNRLPVVHNCIHRGNYLRSHLVQGRSLWMMNGELMTHSFSSICRYRAALAAKDILWSSFLSSVHKGTIPVQCSSSSSRWNNWNTHLNCWLTN